VERHFEKELENLKNTFIRMESLVDARLGSAYRALFEGDLDRERTVIAAGREADRDDTLIDRQFQDIVALTQGVAIDLRLLLTGVRIKSTLEQLSRIPVNSVERAEPLSPAREVSLEGCGTVVGPAVNVYVKRH